MFNRFEQADIEDKRASQGSGLGLAISKAYVEMLDGKIWVDSEPGRGSVFYFTLPYNPDSKETKNVKAEESDVFEKRDVRKLNILIAEDDEPSEELLSIMLESISQKVFKSKTGKETIEICRNNPDIDLVLMDIQMPEINGLEATRQIRKFNKDVIIIAQTAFALSGDSEKAVEAGCNAHISKPISKSKLLLMIQKYCM
ncbi:MAG: response regulator [Bacteroidales bacterium]|nr:response regulator [Bacteroidales bacterium]